ncbi:type I pullulanase [Desertibacillus haloalkaliphilus]|uniref:type I pullulanase n=1 Tax=Desertibacillus haloalkaliphilus TaxID=1328930 RepID=UPI001C25BD48|nr:type I pullulanase [Desertibacillus haloalkaliphilus]MBU8905254.1 type I pullulanase [Desertibacillus haloalkaliphilus]
MDHLQASFVSRATIDQLDVITVSGDMIALHDDKLTFIVKQKDKVIPIKNIQRKADAIKLKLEQTLPLGNEFTLFVNDDAYPVTVGEVVRTKRFDRTYSYSGSLGPLYDQKETTFKVWAPTAIDVRLVIYLDTNDHDGTEFAMARAEKGVWLIRLLGDQHGLLYTYLVCVDGQWQEAVDPYAKTVTTNGEKGQVVDLTKTEPNKWCPRPPFTTISDAIIYEAHLRDLSVSPDSGIKNKGKFLGLTERQTHGPNQTATGVEHLIDVGITHLELLPLNDFGSIDESLAHPPYNWGYDPTHYFAPEGSYASDPEDGLVRVCELKEMIASLHEAGIRVIIDVVFNHAYVWETSNFEKIVPGYYFRYKEDGELANGSGVGNDTASEREMMRKFMIDCVTYWATEYRVDGFRFDLMGLHDRKTMRMIRKALDQIDPNIVILGEGWDLDTPLRYDQKAMIDQAKKLPDICFFNDRFRDMVKGSTFQSSDRGFINGNKDTVDPLKVQIQAGLRPDGTTMFAQPFQSVNYIESHDNHTLTDKLALSNPDESTVWRQRMQRLGTALVLFSQGTPFLHAGQEFYRTKGGVENSYNAPDHINQLDWKRKAMYEDDVKYVKGLIAIRKAHPIFRLQSYDQIHGSLTFFDTPSHVIGYMLTDIRGDDTWSRVVVIHNGSWSTIEIPFEDGEWNVVVDEKSASLVPLYKINVENLLVKPLNTIVLYQV